MLELARLTFNRSTPRLRTELSRADVVRAESRYAKALELFADRPRGRAAVMLRRAYLASLRGDHDDAAHRARAAESACRRGNASAVTTHAGRADRLRYSESGAA
ncbi:hypothetical protein [Catenulispora subtropica]|uniref:Uncharacterized protein n=1 Tax=Catenulispora subtropica TaxID=450798 RepID=A0ABP5BSB3_9ACTN